MATTATTTIVHKQLKCRHTHPTVNEGGDDNAIAKTMVLVEWSYRPPVTNDTDNKMLKDSRGNDKIHNIA